MRGRVFEADQTRTAPAFIEWRHPGNPLFRMVMSLIGIAPIVGLIFMDWIQIQAGYLAGSAEEDVFKNKLSLLTSLNEVGEVIASRVFTPFQVEESEAFMLQFMGFGWIFMVVAGLFAGCALFILLSVFACGKNSTRKRAGFGYLGFSLGTAAPIVFIYAISSVNRMAGQNAVDVTLYPYLAILAGILAMVYCVRYPALTDITNRRTPFSTRAVTTFVPVKGDGVKESLRKVVFTTALICFIYFGATLGIDLFNSWLADLDQRRRQGLLNAEVNMEDSAFDGLRGLSPLPDYLALYAQNNDMVGYIRIGDTRVDYPVLQTDNNGYYLDHNFDKNPDMYGAIFADYRNQFEREHGRISDNTILYGHNSQTGNFFAALSNYHPAGSRFNDMQFYRDYPVIIFDTLFEKMEWKIFGVVLFNTQEEHGEVYNYWGANQIEFPNEDSFHKYILEIMDRSAIFTDVDIEYGDNILTLSTCFWPMGRDVDTRCVIFARRVREGESSNVDVSKAVRNNGVRRFTREANAYGNSWNGRVWDYKTYLTSYKGD
jgi:sortase B